MINKIIFVGLCLLSGITLTNMSPEGFERFKNNYFVETGTFVGDGIKLALRAKFPNIYSIELNPKFVDYANSMFAQIPTVHIIPGDSGKILFDVIKEINEPITFWLDGHNGSPDPAGGKNTPLMLELEQIGKHHIKCHTILIDDMHCCNTILFDNLQKEDIIRKIKEINPNYCISYVNGGDKGQVQDNIMVAFVP